MKTINNFLFSCYFSLAGFMFDMFAVFVDILLHVFLVEVCPEKAIQVIQVMLQVSGSRQVPSS